jgi:acyl dehydratase
VTDTPDTTTDWFTLTQADVDDHAARTGDDDWVHTDPARVAAEGGLEGTIVQGSLILSQLVRLSRVLPRPAGERYGLNYGFDRVRFVAPLLVGTPVRARFEIAEVTPRGPGKQLTAMDVTFETAERVVAVARWKGLSVLS